MASGKTAVYAAAIDAALAAGRDALVLVPGGVAGAAPRRPAAARPGHRAGAASTAACRPGNAPMSGAGCAPRPSPQVVVGTRLAILAPVRDPGVIVVDEEHDPAYKSDRTPRYQARDLALELGRLAGAPVILGSATPDIVSVGQGAARVG